MKWTTRVLDPLSIRKQKVTVMTWTYNPDTIQEYYDKWIKLGWRATGEPYKGTVDPERLIVETTHVGRYDGRLLKAMRTWLRNHHDLLNVQRLLHFIEDADQPVLGATVEIAVKHGKGGQRLLTIPKHCKPYKEPQVLGRIEDEFGVYEAAQKEFGLQEYRKWGLYCTMAEFYDDAMYTRAYVLEHNPLLALRALVGPNIRAEILFALENLTRTHIKALAQTIGYAYSAVYTEVMNMVKNGFLTAEDYGRVKVISMNKPMLQYLRKIPV